MRHRNSVWVFRDVISMQIQSQAVLLQYQVVKRFAYYLQLIAWEKEFKKKNPSPYALWAMMEALVYWFNVGDEHCLGQWHSTQPYLLNAESSLHVISYTLSCAADDIVRI